jgi:hypothetical protein
MLGYDLGPTGVDGVFLGRTAEAVSAFQDTMRLSEDSVVGELTWAALVDATFTLGDRVLYLRLPHFHGCDVRVLQEALNALGFACGATDGIFGAFTERAVAEFQRNAALPADGIAGDDTVRAINALRHVWVDKPSASHSAAQTGPARAAEVLARTPFAVAGLDRAGTCVAQRLANLAFATTAEARVTVLDESVRLPEDTVFVLRICGHGSADSLPGRPVVRRGDSATFASRLRTAFETARRCGGDVAIELEDVQEGDEHAEQRAAVQLLDAVCAVFDRASS